MLRTRPQVPALFLGSVLAASAATALAPSIARADDVTITPEARTRFSSGVNLLKDPDGPRYEEAYREFKAAYASSPSYKILGNLGLCAMKLERDDEAIQAYSKYLEHKKELEPAEVTQVRTDLETLKSGVVYVNLTSDPPGAKIVDTRLPVRGDRVTNGYGPLATAARIGIRQGSHQITAKLDGYPDVTWEFDASGTELAHTFAFKKPEVAPPVTAIVPPPEAPKGPIEPPRTSRPIPTGVYVSAIATGALAAGAIVTGILALNEHSTYQTQNDGTNPSQASSTKSTGEALNIVNDVCFGGAIVAAGVAVVLYVTRPTVMEDTKPVASSWMVAPMVSQNGGGLGFSGRF